MTDVVQLDFDRIQVYNPAIGRWKLGLGNPLGITIADTASADAFNRLRTSNPQTMFDFQGQYDAEELKMETGATGAGVTPAHGIVDRMVTLRVNAGGAGGTSWIQSFHYIPYQPGKSQLILMTGVMGAAVAGALKRYGYGDASNGIFYEQDGTNGLRFNILSAVTGSLVNNFVTQANWNIDKFDGSGPSGLVLDPTKAFILVIDLQFLGMGRVRCGFEINGNLYYAHQFLHSNLITTPYMQTATLPVKAEIVASAALASAATSEFKCAAVCSEGGYDIPPGRDFAVEGNATAASGARTHILSIRPATTYDGLPNRSLLVIESIEFLAGANPIYFEICIGATFAVAPAWAAVNALFSSTEYGTGGTFGNLANGAVIVAGYVGTGGGGGRTAHTADFYSSYPLSLDRAGAQRALGTLSVLVSGIGGTSASRCAINWREQR